MDILTQLIANGVLLGTIGATTLDVVAGAAGAGVGGITQTTGGLNVSGASSFTAAGDPIDLTISANNDFGDTAGGAVSATGADVDLFDTDAIALGAISATSLAVDADSIAVTGAIGVTGPANSVNLDLDASASHRMQEKT